MTDGIFTVDVEEYYHAENILYSLSQEKIEALPDRLEIGLVKILNLLELNKATATFFVLGCLAEKNKGLIRKVVSLGHEVASHGYLHKPLYRHTPQSFEEDLDRSVKLLSDITGQKVVGYRATGFSLYRRLPWFFDALRRHGMIYDSSLSPSLFHRPVDGSLLGRSAFEIDSGIMEFPVPFIKIGPLKIPTGGGYFRAFPYWFTSWGLGYLRRGEGAPSLFYIHPWELDPQQRRCRIPPIKYLRHYINLGSTERKLGRLLSEMSFISVKEFYRSAHIR